MLRRKWYTQGFLAELQKLLEREPTSKNAGLTLPAKELSNISKYPGHLADIACFDGSPRNQGHGGVDEACVNKTSYGPKGRRLDMRDQATVPVNLPDLPVQFITLGMLYLMHFAHLR
ncbi:uncharacterized protein TNCV_473171 [Trichonephila clavipes]|nr:uncharacterized protein TNCV_473171 [Trichonephila clavipes]